MRVAVLSCWPLLISTCGLIIGLPASAAAPIEFSYQSSSGFGLLLPSVLYYDTGAVTYHDGKFHMFYNCQYDWPPTDVNIAYAVSEDGRAWQTVKKTTIIREVDIPYDVFSIMASSVLVMDDGTWVLYFSTWGNGAEYVQPSYIGRATAPSPEGPWTVDPQPVLVPGAGGWDSDSVQRPDVVYVGGVYYMYYLGTGPAGGMIGRASSPDGIHWAKYNDPATQAAIYAESDPVFTPDQSGDASLELRYPRVLVTPSGWLLFYWTSTPGWPQQDPLHPTNGLIRLATSSDGTHWSSAQDEPLITPEDMGRTVTALYTPCIVLRGDVYHMLLEKEMTTGTTLSSRIVLATCQGPIRP